MGENYFNKIPWREARLQLGHCRSMAKEEFADGVNALKGKKIVIVGCGAQGLNQGMCLRDSGLDVSYALRDSAITEKRQSWKNATENGFNNIQYYSKIFKHYMLVTPKQYQKRGRTIIVPSTVASVK